MAEFVKSAKLTIEIETNKAQYKQSFGSYAELYEYLGQWFFGQDGMEKDLEKFIEYTEEQKQNRGNNYSGDEGMIKE